MSFVKELDGSGFIDRLYKAKPVVAGGETRNPLLPKAAQRKVSTVQKKELVSDAKRTPEKLAQASKTSSGSTEHTVRAGDTSATWHSSTMAMHANGSKFTKPIRKL